MKPILNSIQLNAVNFIQFNSLAEMNLISWIWLTALIELRIDWLQFISPFD